MSHNYPVMGNLKKTGKFPKMEVTTKTTKFPNMDIKMTRTEKATPKRTSVTYTRDRHNPY